MLEGRSAYKNLINKIETTYPVNEWMHNGYHVWPVLRIRLYLMLVKQFENSRDSKKTSNRKSSKIAEKMKDIPKAISNYSILRNNTDTIYCGAPSHRVHYLGKLYNRYFDRLMDKESVNNLLMERDSDSKKNYYKPERVLLISVLSSWYNIHFKFSNKSHEFHEYNKELKNILSKFEINVEKFISNIPNYIYNIDRTIFLYDKILRKLNPKKIHILCYYSSSMLGLNIAADKLGIKTTDMQHGPQGEHHLAYGSWENVPEKGYEALPNEFHTWDESSANTINQWAKDTAKHSTVVTGNPWVEGWKRGAFKSSDYFWPKNLVLYTLQPTGNPLEPFLLETIKKTRDDWDWWLRLHPRQLEELVDIEHKLKEYGLLDDVNLHDATNRLLPEILVNTKVHLTKFSGCAIEAFNFETPSVILDERGVIMFNDYFEYDIMNSCLSKDSELLIKTIQKYMG